jgi:tRNA(Arg) A34 adenosine deaminase TadA
MREAIAEALRSIELGGGPFGAVVVREGELIGRGHNRVLLDADPCAHAEILAIRAACRELGSHLLAGCEIYTSCEPCPMCLGAIHWARLERVHYACTREDAAAAGFDDARFHAELALPVAERSIPLLQEMRAEGLEALRVWARKADRRLY